MLDSLTNRLTGIFDRLRGFGRLTEENIQEALREVRVALLEADVNFKVVKGFIDRVRVKAVGQDVLQSLTPGQQVVKVVRDELVELLGGSAHRLALAPHPPTVVMLVGGAPEQLDQLVAYHLDHLLAGRQRLEHVLPDRLHAHAVDEALRDLEVDVGLQQGHAHFAQGLLDVLLRQPAESAEPIEDAGQTIGQAIEHRVLPPGDRFVETLKDTDEAGKSQALLGTSDALRRATSAAPGSDAPKMAEPATSTVAPACARSPALSALTPPSTETSTGRSASIARRRRIFS